MDMQYGTETITRSFFDGKMMKKKLIYSIPIKIADRSQALTEFIKALELISSGKSEEITLRIKAPKYKLQSMTKEYSTGEG